MPKKLRTPLYAKQAAFKGLFERRKNKAGLTKKEADRLGITSGVERAKKLIRNKYTYESDAKAIARFYMRFQGCRTKKCETAIRLWGGRRFGRLMAKIYYGYK